MKRAWKITLGLGAVAVLVAMAIPAQAQCTVPQLFGATGDKGVAGRIFIATVANGFPTDGNEIGSLWERGNAAGNNNAGPHFGPGPSTCDCLVDMNWCRSTPSQDMSIFGNLSSSICLTQICQEEKTFVFVVEDRNSDDTDAGFIAYQVDWSTQTVRAFDHARTANPAPQAITTHVMERFPTVSVQSSSGPPPNTTLTNEYANVTINFHGVEGPADDPVPAPVADGGAIQAYDVCTFRGTADPGRDRSNWTCAPGDQVPYTQTATPLADSFAVPCPDTALDTFVAVGIEYVDGIKSVLVGESTAVECDPTIAEPEERKQDRLGVRGRNRMTR